MQINFFFKKTFLIPAVLFLITAFFRLSNLNLIEYKADQAITVFQITQFFSHPYFIQSGLVSSIGTLNFPLFNYIIVVISIISSDPQFLSFSIALINSALVVFFYLIMKKFYNNLALFSAIILAVNPWAILFSRSIWAQDLILLFLLPSFYFLHLVILNKNKKAILPLFLFLTLLSQIHSSGIFFSLATTVILLLKKIKIRQRETLYGILIGLIPAIPYFFLELLTTPTCKDCYALFYYLSSYPKYFDYQVFMRPFQLGSSLFYQFELGKDYSVFLKSFPLLNLINYFLISSWILPLIATYLIFKKERKVDFLIFYLFLIPLFYFLTRTASYIHYFVILLPIIVLIFAYPISYAFTTAVIYFSKVL